MELTRLQKQMQFIKEIDKIKQVMRRNYLSDGSRRENDAEHSWHLAMMVMILSEYFEGIDVLKTMKMVLIHDLVEIYAGDTFAYDEQANIGKEDREGEAAEKLFSLLPQDQADEFSGLWQEFEGMDTKEAICASIVDRIQPLILNAGSKGKMWKKHHVTVDKVLKRNKIVFDKAPEVISEFVRSIISHARQEHYFHNEGD